MKHLQYVKFMALLWVGYDHMGREVANGYVDEGGMACSWDSREVYIGGNKVPLYDILADVNSQMDMIYQRRKMQYPH